MSILISAQHGDPGGLGVDSIDIMNFGHKTGPSSGPNSVLGQSKNDLSKVLFLILG